MIPQKLSPLRSRGPWLGVFHRLHQRVRIAAGQGEEKVLVDLEVEHHLQPLAKIAKVFEIGAGKDIGFAENNRPALTPGQELAKTPQHVILFSMPLSCSLG